MVPVHDVAKFAKTVEGIRKYGYDVNNVVSEFSNLEILKLKQNNLQELPYFDRTSYLFLYDSSY
jgi:hypothetical protein